MLLLVYVVATFVATIQRGVFAFPNDFAIFRSSFWNLVANRDLYVLRPEQAHDLFKYSPTFALLFAPFAVLPFVLGLLLWNLGNALAIFFALRMLLPRDQWAAAQALVALPALRSVQSSQSNALVAALLILAFISFERGWVWRGAIASALGAAIKIFPIVGVVFALPRPHRLRAIMITAVCVILLAALPLIAISPASLVAQYQSWLALEHREAALAGSSAIALFRDAGFDWPAWPIQVIGIAIILAIAGLHLRDWGDGNVGVRFLALVMVFCVVFNHRAERQSAVIAVAGMVIWYLASPRHRWRAALFAIVYFLVVMTSTEVVPASIKSMLASQVRFAIPLTIMWLVMVAELALVRPGRPLIGEVG